MRSEAICKAEKLGEEMGSEIKGTQERNGLEEGTMRRVRRRKMIEVASNRYKRKSDVWREGLKNWRVTGRREETAGR